MAELKRQTFFFSNGKQIKLYGSGFGITRSLEITEASAPNIFWLIEGTEVSKSTVAISNPHKLSAEEIIEVADYCIRQWMDLKDSVRKHGVDSPKIFNREDLKLSDGNKTEPSSKKGNNAQSAPKEKENGKGESAGN